MDVWRIQATGIARCRLLVHVASPEQCPCNSSNCSGHFKNVYDDDDDVGPTAAKVHELTQ